jgi:arsenate reductase
MTQSTTAVFHSIENEIAFNSATSERKHILHHLLILFKRKLARIKKPDSICTHNSRRSHLSQVWAQTAAAHFNVKCFAIRGNGSGIIPMAAKTLTSRIEVPPF